MSADIGNQLTVRPNAVAADDAAQHQRSLSMQDADDDDDDDDV